MAKVAVVDLLFNYPFKGGSSNELYHLLLRLSKVHDITLFMCDYSRSFFLRQGSIQNPEELPFKVHLIPCGWFSYNFKILYHILLRFYAYEILCLKSFHLFRNGRICSNNLLKDSFKCQVCSLNLLDKDNHFFELCASFGLFPFYKRLVKKALSEVRKIIVSNQFTKDILNPWNQNIQVIPGGVDSHRFFPKTHKNKGRLTILFSGRADDPTKGLYVLKRACQILRMKNKNFELVITSKRRFKEDYITSTGWLCQDELIRLYQRSDICVVPSIWQEPFGMVAVEAMACGKPVIASKVGGLQNIVEDRKTGFLVPPGDPEALSEKIEILLADSKLRQDMGEKGREKVEREYDWDKIVERFYLPLFSK